MNIMRRHIASKAFQLFDITLMVCSFLTAAIISLHQRNPNLGPLQLLSMRIKVSNILVFAAMLLIWHVIFEAFHLHRSKRLAGRRKEILDAVEATTLGTIVIATCLWLLHMRLLSPTFLLAFWVFITALTIASRLVLREVLAIICARGACLRSFNEERLKAGGRKCNAGQPAPSFSRRNSSCARLSSWNAVSWIRVWLPWTRASAWLRDASSERSARAAPGRRVAPLPAHDFESDCACRWRRRGCCHRSSSAMRAFLATCSSGFHRARAKRECSRKPQRATMSC